MGTYTAELKLYKPDPNEFVDVETQLNRNWDIADKSVRRLMEYEYSNLSVPDAGSTPDNSRFYKSYSNSFMALDRTNNVYFQDTTAFVSEWKKALVNNTDQFEASGFPLYYRVIKKNGGTTTEIEWTGAFDELGTPMQLNTNVVQVMILPAETIPQVTKYFTVNAGNATNSYSIARLAFASGAAGTADMGYKRYGAAAGTSSSENRIELTGIKYCIEAPA